MTKETFVLEKPVWTDADFEQMGWHDVHIHAIALHPELFEFWLDVDYIFRWLNPQSGETYYRFWIAPATLVFTSVHNLKLDIDSHGGDLSLQGIERDEPSHPRNAEHTSSKREWLWRLDCNEGAITFHSVGFMQFTRRPPILQRGQRLTLEERGGISFAREYSA